MPSSVLILLDAFHLKPRSTICSCQDVVMILDENTGTVCGDLVIMLINPPMASDPYKPEAGPFTISIRSMSWLGIPNKPYTDERLLTIGIPSIVTMVYGPSRPFIWMSPVLHTLQLICGLTP